jgi:pheromone shutdown-related protein TraB
MFKYKNLTIVGTSHIAEGSLKEVEETFLREQPDMVAVELDRDRLFGLLSGNKPSYSPKLIPQLGLKGYLFAVIGSIVQQKLGDIVGIKPGSDMLHAVNLARKSSKKIALIDQDVRVTLARLSKAITWKERWHFVVDIFSAPFAEKMKINLKEVPERELIKKLLGLLKKRYPGIHKALVEERNHFMALRLHTLMKNYPDQKIMAVIGAGHEEEMLSLVKKAFSSEQSAAKGNLYKEKN